MNSELEHVAFFLPSLRGGGAEKVIFSIAKEASKSIKRVDLVLVENVGTYSQLDPGKVNIVDLKKSRAFSSIPSLTRYLKEQRPNVLLSALPHANIAALLANKISRTRTPIVISERSMMSRHTKPNLRLAITLKAMKYLYQEADSAIAISEQVRKAVINGTSLPNEHIRVIHNPIDANEIELLRSETPTIEWLANKTQHVIITAGRLVEEKDQATLISALADLEDVRLVILGEGPLRGELENLVRHLNLQSRVCMPGFVENPYAEISRADLFVLPSKSEGFANVVIEALACQTPVVATRNSGGIADALENGTSVRLVPISNREALTSEIRRSINTKVDISPRQILEPFSLESCWANYSRVLAAAVTNRIGN